jgi:hypothetical protein
LRTHCWQRKHFPSAVGALISGGGIGAVALAASMIFAAPKPILPAQEQQRWIVVSSAVVLLNQVPGASALVARAFDNSDTFVIYGPSPEFMRQWRSLRTRSFGSYRDLKNALDQSNQLRAVVYDAERWRFTPPEEQKEPGRFAKLAAAVAHRHGLIFVATPATDLVKSIERQPGPIYPAFIRLGIAGKVAPWADVYEIQAQGSENNLDQYRWFVAQAAAQARRANPHVVVLAGLSTNNPTDRQVTARQLYEAAQATRSVVDGYWLNVPRGGPYCPQCGAPKPKVGVEFLRMLYGRPPQLN